MQGWGRSDHERLSPRYCASAGVWGEAACGYLLSQFLKPLGPRAWRLHSALPGSSCSVLLPDRSLSLQHRISWGCPEEWLLSRFPWEKFSLSRKCDRNQAWGNDDAVVWWWESKERLRASQFSLLPWGWGRVVQGWQRIPSAGRELGSSQTASGPLPPVHYTPNQPERAEPFPVRAVPALPSSAEGPHAPTQSLSRALPVLRHGARLLTVPSRNAASNSPTSGRGEKGAALSHCGRPPDACSIGTRTAKPTRMRSSSQ